MKKIMFNDRFGLTQAVLDGRKTMTRRIVNKKQIKHALFVQKEYNISFEEAVSKYTAPYLVWEEIAIAQSYKDCGYTELTGIVEKGNTYFMGFVKGWNNKMFVKAELMPHHIRINNIRVERLQDISEKDCLQEGIRKDYDGAFFVDNPEFCFSTGRRAFSYLINKVSGKGTWERNPWVYVYEFKLVD